MSPLRRLFLVAGAPLTVALVLAGCRDGPSTPTSGAAGPPVASTAVTPAAGVPTWQARLLASLPHVDGATRAGQDLSAATATETWLVPPAAPACRAVLTRLAANGYRVLAGSGPDVLTPDTCTPEAGRGTVLAAGGAQVALSWTTDTYTVRVLP